jgi:hypothetical protein
MRIPYELYDKNNISNMVTILFRKAISSGTFKSISRNKRFEDKDGAGLFKLTHEI